MNEFDLIYGKEHYEEKAEGRPRTIMKLSEGPAEARKSFSTLVPGAEDLSIQG